MRSALDRSETPRDLRRRLERLEGLPLRPVTAREVLALAESGDRDPGWPAVAELDPGAALARLRPGPVEPLSLVAERPWWPRQGGEAPGGLWRHGVAVACAARRLAAETEDEVGDPARWARIGLLHHLGLWALAAVAPEALAALLAEPDPARRRGLERAWLGIETTALGRDLAERWGCDPALIDAAWLHADPGGDLLGCALGDPEGLRLIQRAVRRAERTPWALSPPDGAEPGPADPRQRLLTAEVQVRCGLEFVAADASPHEERLARSHARLLQRTADLERGLAARDRFLRTFAESDPTDDPQTWADRAALAWCAEPGVAAARVAWTGRETPPAPDDPARPAQVVPLGRRGRPGAEVHLRTIPDGPRVEPDRHPARAAWQAWADLVADRDRLASRLAATLAAHRQRADAWEHDLRLAKLEGLAEFAAGAGHELNNPLAVIQGRAQLLLARADEPETARSLRAIIGQAQRAHRMLRDLIYVARPPAPRPRPCRPDEVVLSCVRDLQDEAEARKVRLVAEPGGAPSAWTDPDPLRHLAEVLLRNALEATPPGGTVRVTTTGDDRHLDWIVRDSGRGLDPREAKHLLDPFFCGRQAGRGLGLGLPRAARAAALAGGSLTWRSALGRGTTFHLTLPLLPPPDEADAPTLAG